jgi:hypothetical protein
MIVFFASPRRIQRAFAVDAQQFEGGFSDSITHLSPDHPAGKIGRNGWDYHGPRPGNIRHAPLGFA